MVDGGSAVGVDQAQGGQGGLGDLVLQLAARQFVKHLFIHKSGTHYLLLVQLLLRLWLRMLLSELDMHHRARLRETCFCLFEVTFNFA